MARAPAAQAARIQALHAAGMGDVAIATKLQIGLMTVRRVLEPAPPTPPRAPKPEATADAPSAERPRPTRRIASIDGPSPVDIHVGRQVRLHRTVAGLSQTQLAEAIGLTFQQVQKYERGGNRISASMLTRIAATLGVPVPTFFPGYEGADDGQNDGVALRREAIELSRAYERIVDQELRDALMGLFHKLGDLLPPVPEPPAAPTGRRLKSKEAATG